MVLLCTDKTNKDRWIVDGVVSGCVIGVDFCNSMIITVLWVSEIFAFTTLWMVRSKAGVGVGLHVYLLWRFAIGCQRLCALFQQNGQRESQISIIRDGSRRVVLLS